MINFQSCPEKVYRRRTTYCSPGNIGTRRLVYGLEYVSLRISRFPMEYFIWFSFNHPSGWTPSNRSSKEVCPILAFPGLACLKDVRRQGFYVLFKKGSVSDVVPVGMCQQDFFWKHLFSVIYVVYFSPLSGAGSMIAASCVLDRRPHRHWFRKARRDILEYSSHWRGLEPLTARFVAGYSIQLSYQCRIMIYNALSARFFQAESAQKM